MKVAYISYLPLADVDFSYLHEAQKYNDVTCYLFVNPKHIRGSVISIKELKGENGIYSWDIYPELKMYEGFIDLSKLYIVNIVNERHWKLKALNQLNKLSKILISKFDVVHITNPLQWYEWPLFRMRKRCVLTVHDPILHSGMGWLKQTYWENIRKLSFKYLDNFILLNNQQTDEFVKEYNLKNKNIENSQLSIYTCLRLIRPVQDVGFDKPYVLFFGKISKYKGVNYLFQSIKLLNDKGKEIYLIVAGNGDFGFDISEYQNSKYIEIRHRFIPDNELVSLIMHAKFVVCPYIDATQSGVIMSAFTFNKPVIATNVGGLPEMVIDNYYGKIVEKENIDQLSLAIEDLYRDDSLVDEYSQNINRDYGIGGKSWNEIALRIQDTYTHINKTDKT